ncbi:hypothetical protein X759_21725 [Mesorhizobium sp. LSHC420B00]|nr:hypothetical protein X759_21725 [Mesorhizobium sp. LSHC420B00]
MAALDATTTAAEASTVRGRVACPCAGNPRGRSTPGKGSEVEGDTVTCPCCNQSVSAPALGDLIAERRISGHAAALLEAVWRGKGMPVMSHVVFDALYADDPDGGPSPTVMYRALRKAFDGLSARLKDTGVSVVEVGYRQGFRLVLHP